MVAIELTQETHALFNHLKTTIEEMSGESVTDDQVVDFMIRSMLGSVEAGEDDGCGCCCGHDHHSDHADHEHHHCHCEEEGKTPGSCHC